MLPSQQADIAPSVVNVVVAVVVTVVVGVVVVAHHVSFRLPTFSDFGFSVSALKPVPTSSPEASSCLGFESSRNKKSIFLEKGILRRKKPERASRQLLEVI